MKEKLLNLLTELKPEIDFEKETGLVDRGILDSFDVVMLSGDIMETFGIELEPEDVIPDNFNGVDAMIALIEKRKQ